MKKLIVLVLLLSHSFLAMANVSEEIKIELLEFVKNNARTVNTITIGDLFSEKTVKPEILTINDFYTISALDFSDTDITYIPNNLYLFENLKEININNTNIEEIPKELGKIYKSWNLYASNTNLIYLPIELFEGNLNTLNISYTKIEELPFIIPTSNLYSLNISYNNFKQIPIYLFSSKLTYLDVSYNNIKEVPEELGNLINLKHLNLSNNEIENIPDSFLNLKNLRGLALNNNKIKKLPTNFFTIFENEHYEYSIPYYKTGAYFDISHNKLSFLDSSICKSFKFSDFNFYDNYFEKIPSCLSKPYATKPNIYTIIDIYGNRVNDTFSEATKYLVEQAGWKFAEDIIIYYTHENSKTIKFEPIYQIDMNIESYLWNFGDGNSLNEETPTHTYQNYGEYNVTLTINNDTTFSKLITISPRVIELKKGWNMITSPTKDDINTSLFSETWSYQNDTWENSHNYLIPTIGYWVKLSEDLNYSYSGEVYELPNYKIKSGWNFVGSGEKYFRENNQTIYQYKNSEWRINPKEIKRGDGFWIKRK